MQCFVFEISQKDPLTTAAIATIFATHLTTDQLIAPITSTPPRRRSGLQVSMRVALSAPRAHLKARDIRPA